jgi:hypothetical protein
MPTLFVFELKEKHRVFIEKAIAPKGQTVYKKQIVKYLSSRGATCLQRLQTKVSTYGALGNLK